MSLLIRQSYGQIGIWGVVEAMKTRSFPSEYDETVLACHQTGMSRISHRLDKQLDSDSVTISLWYNSG